MQEETFSGFGKNFQAREWGVDCMYTTSLLLYLDMEMSPTTTFLLLLNPNDRQSRSQTIEEPVLGIANHHPVLVNS